MMEEEVLKAKVVVEKSFGVGAGRKWLESNIDSYGDESYRVSLFVLEGSPPKGLVIVDYNNRLVEGRDMFGKKVFRRKN